MAPKFHRKVTTVRYPGGVRADITPGGVTWHHNGLDYRPGTVGAYLSARVPGIH